MISIYINCSIFLGFPGIFLLLEKSKSSGWFRLATNCLLDNIRKSVLYRLGSTAMGHHGRDVFSGGQGKSVGNHRTRLLGIRLRHHQILQYHFRLLRAIHCFLDFHRILPYQHCFCRNSTTRDQRQKPRANPKRIGRWQVGRL